MDFDCFFIVTRLFVEIERCLGYMCSAIKLRVSNEKDEGFKAPY